MPVNKHIFLPGNVRSGTTWITKWLASHPDIACCHNIYLLNHVKRMLNPRADAASYVRTQDVRVFMDSVFNHHSLGREIMLESSPGDISYPLTDNKNPERSSEPHISHLIHSIYENAYVLILYRDGKNWVHSLMNLPWKSYHHEIEKMTELWIFKMRTLLAPTPRNTLHIKYEDLLYNNAYRDILSFLELEHFPLVAWEKSYGTRYSSYDPDRWKSLSKEQIKIMERMNPMLEKAGYETI